MLSNEIGGKCVVLFRQLCKVEWLFHFVIVLVRFVQKAHALIIFALPEEEAPVCDHVPGSRSLVLGLVGWQADLLRGIKYAGYSCTRKLSSCH